MDQITQSLTTGKTAIPLKNITIGELLDQAVAKFANNTALVSCHQNISWTYAELNQKAEHFAKGLLSIGVLPGDRIGIWSPNNVEWILTMYAAAKMGAILVNINPAYKPTELSYALNKVGCKALVMAKQFKTSIYTDMLQTLAPEVVTCESGNLQAAQLPELKSLILISEQAQPGYLLFNDLLNKGQSSSLKFTGLSLENAQTQFNANSAINIQFTSGTTGSPKGATLTHNNIVNNAYFAGLGINLSEHDKICTPVPLYHCFGMVLSLLAAANFGSSVVLPALSYDPQSTLEAIQSQRCTALYGVPTMFNMMLNSPDFGSYNLSSLRTGIVAGSLCPPEIMRQVIEKLNMREVTNCYGMTETSPISFQTGLNDAFERRTTTVGTVVPHTTVKIVDKHGATVPIGQRGEICTQGYCVMQGYWGDPEKTNEAIENGWMKTGDEGILDEHGYLQIVGRIKDIIIRGGENIAPKEIEEYLFQHSSIEEVQAFGIPDEKFGEIVCVWIKVKQGYTLTEQEVTAFCEGKIAHFKVPGAIRFVDEFPLTVTGKIQKYKMREMMEQEKTG